MAPDNGDGLRKASGLVNVQRLVGIIAAIATTVATVGGFYVAISARGGPSPIGGGSSISAPTVTPAPPTSVMLQASAPGLSPTTQDHLSVRSGTTVTLTVVPDHSMTPFQTYTMGIYAQDPYGFSELQYCRYPNTDHCSYVVSYSDSEQTDYTQGTHTFTGFLGDIGGAILYNSNDITIIWSQ